MKILPLLTSIVLLSHLLSAQISENKPLFLSNNFSLDFSLITSKSKFEHSGKGEPFSHLALGYKFGFSYNTPICKRVLFHSGFQIGLQYYNSGINATDEEFGYPFDIDIWYKGSLPLIETPFEFIYQHPLNNKINLYTGIGLNLKNYINMADNITVSRGSYYDKTSDKSIVFFESYTLIEDYHNFSIDYTFAVGAILNIKEHLFKIGLKASIYVEEKDNGMSIYKNYYSLYDADGNILGSGKMFCSGSYIGIETVYIFNGSKNKK